MSNHKLIVENWRKFLKDEEKEEKQELNEGVLANLGLALGLGGAPEMQDQSGFENNIKGIEMQVPGGKELKVAFSGEGQPDADITLKELINNLKTMDTEEANEAIVALVDIVKISKKNFNVDLNVDRDGDGYADYTGVQNFDSYLGDDGSQFLYNTVNPQQDTGSQNIEMPKDLKVEVGKSPQGKKQLVVTHKSGKKLTPEQLKKIALANGINGGYTTNANAGIGMLVITAN